ncbi:phosphosulfolactate synthase [Bacillus kwashiorkori]|uniref:phosphosulfolactate synthase n=1 Tax=Bacillus kwashiorkori TaxID=1522318 RepID=UPI000785D772|nr:phosphosulfolactate synthase [Bacillus kwashiorkori]
MEFLNLPKRTKKKRTYGLTSIVDFGTSVGELKNILKDYSDFIDIAKLGIGTAYLTPNLNEKISLYKSYNIIPYCGGTLFEKCYYENKLIKYKQFLKQLDIHWVEVSNGTLNISLEERLHIINQLKKDFHVIAEVGSKDAKKEMPIYEWKKEVQLLLDAGCDYVITEGRDSGTSGIYTTDGNVKSNLIRELITDIDYKKIIFEAPSPKQQMYFINEIGPNVNLGNVKIHDCLLLETERAGLRSETFFLEDSSCKLPL